MPKADGWRLYTMIICIGSFPFYTSQDLLLSQWPRMLRCPSTPPNSSWIQPSLLSREEERDCQSSGRLLTSLSAHKQTLIWLCGKMLEMAFFCLFWSLNRVVLAMKFAWYLNEGWVIKINAFAAVGNEEEQERRLINAVASLWRMALTNFLPLPLTTLWWNTRLWWLPKSVMPSVVLRLRVFASQAIHSTCLHLRRVRSGN